MRFFILLLSISLQLTIAVGLTSTYASHISESDVLISAHTPSIDFHMSIDLLVSDFDYRVFDGTPIRISEGDSPKVPVIGFVTIRGRDPPIVSFKTGTNSNQVTIEPIDATTLIYRFARDGLSQDSDIS